MAGVLTAEEAQGHRPMDADCLLVRATGERNADSNDAEINLVGYFSVLSNQQVMLARQPPSLGWRLTPAAVGGIEFANCLLSRNGELRLPRLQGAFLAAISHPWSGILELETYQGLKRVDLYSPAPRAISIDTGNGVVREIEPEEVRIFCEMFADADADPSLIDQREIETERRPAMPPEAASPRTALNTNAAEMLGWVEIVATDEPADVSVDSLVAIAEIEPMAGVFADLARLERDAAWASEMRVGPDGARLAVLVSRSGKLRLKAEVNGSISFLCGPDGGFVEVGVFGRQIRLNLFAHTPRLYRVDFAWSPLKARAEEWTVEKEAFRQRRLFYSAALSRVDPNQPLALYVPRWKGVAASTKNLFQQTMPFPHTLDGHPSDITPEDIKFLVHILLSSSVKHFVVSGGDTFWISAIRRLQKEDPRIRFDVLWHSNYLQMDEPHDWNLLTNWLHAVADGMVTRMAVVKQGLERLLRRLGVDSSFIPNFIKSDPAAIRYSGVDDLVGIWLSGSSSYRKVP